MTLKKCFGFIENPKAQKCLKCNLLYDCMDEAEITLCIDCEKVVQRMDIPLCDECAKKYDLERFWRDHDTENPKGWYEPVDFIENWSVREKYLKH
jgi:hypothetical protein